MATITRTNETDSVPLANRKITNGYMRGGAARVYMASRDEKSLKQAADEFNSKGYPGKCIPLTANLATYEGVTGLVAELEKREKCELSSSAPRRNAMRRLLASRAATTNAFNCD